MTEHEADAFDEPYEDPGEFLDEIEVERLMRGDQTIPIHRNHKHTAELVETVRRLTALGFSDRRISRHLANRVSQDAVFKIRYRHGIASGVTPGTSTFRGVAA